MKTDNLLNLLKKIVLYLGFPSPERFTGHSFHRPSASVLVSAGADMLILIRQKGWQSSSVAERDVGTSTKIRNTYS